MKQSFQQVDFIRHEQSRDNLGNSQKEKEHQTIGGQNIFVPLSAEGERRALALAAYPISSDALLVPSMAVRSIQTAHIGFPAHDIQTPDSRFLELSQGVHEGQLVADVHTSEYFAALKALGWDYRAPEGESLNEVADRMLDGANDWAEQADGKQLVVVGHTTAIRGLTGRLLGLSQDEAVRGQKIANGQVSRISRQGSGDWKVDFVGVDAAVVADQDRKNK